MFSIKEETPSIKQDPPRRSLLIMGAIASWVLVVIFSMGVSGFAVRSGRFAFLQNNWLVILFKLNTGSDCTQENLLNLFNFLDLTIMLLFCVLFIALYAIFHHTHKLWSIITTSLPFLGILLFLITHTAGRSALLIGVLIFSVMMAKSSVFNNVHVLLGISGSALLFFAGDIGTAVFASSILIAISIATGYLLWIAWFVLVGWSLFSKAREVTRLHQKHEEMV